MGWGYSRSQAGIFVKTKYYHLIYKVNGSKKKKKTFVSTNLQWENDNYARRYSSWFKVAVSVTDSDGPETYNGRGVSVDTQNKMIEIFKNY